MRILITRPRLDAESFAATLVSRGIDVTVEPLLTIQPVPAPVIDLEGVQAVLFTSANGVRCFADADPRRDLRGLAVGDGSAAAAREAGFTQVENAAGDVASLATLVTDRLRPGDGALLHAAGSSLAGDLKGQLEAAGFTVKRTTLYDAIPAPELSPATLMNLRLGGIDAVTLFSPRSARGFADLWRKAQAPDGATQGLQKVTALCLSAAVAREIKDLDWRRIEIAAHPDIESLLALAEIEKQRRDAEMSSSAQESGQSSDTIDADMRAAAASDAAAGAAIVAAMPKPASASRGGSLLLSLLAGAIAGGAVVVAEPYWRPYLPWPSEAENAPSLASLGADIADLKRQLAAQESAAGIDAEARQNIATLQSEIASWKDQLTQATGNSGDTPSAVDLGPIEMRLAALEEKLNALANAAPSAMAGDGTVASPDRASADAATADLAALTTRLAELEGKLSGLGDAAMRLDSLSAATATQQAEIATAKAKLENVTALTERLAALESEAKTLGAGLSEMSHDNADIALKRQRAAALVLALGQLRATLSGDRPFAAELAAAEDLGRGDPDLAAKLIPALAPLKPFAASGAPTLTQLQAELPAAAIAQAASADAAGAALGVESGWLQKTLNRLSELVTVRPVGDVEGEGALAHLARAEARLGAGDLAAAVAELKGLTGQAATACQDWLVRAEARLTIDAAAGQLTTLSAEALVPAANAGDGAAAPEQSN